MSTLAAAPTTDRAKMKELPEPLCKPWRHPIRWSRNTAQTLITAGIFAYFGMLIIVALYYLILQTTPTMTNWWHNTVPNSDIRHNIRNIGEGLLGGLLAQQIIWSHYKKKTQKRLTKKRGLLDRLEIALHIPNVKDGKPFSVGQLIATPFLVIIYAIPGFVVGLWLVGVFHRNSNLAGLVQTPSLPTHSSAFQKMEQTFTQDWPKKLVGYFSAFFFGRRPAKGVFDDVQLLFAERRVAKHAPLRWYHPPTFKARYNDVNNSTAPFAQHSVWMERLVVGAIPIALGLAIFGWYVLTYIAT